MNSARGEIMAAIARNKARHRQADIPAHIVPQRALLPEPQRLELFETMVRKSAASIEQIGSLAELPTVIHRYLHNMGLQQQCVYLNNLALAPLNWNALKGHTISVNPKDCNDGVGVAPAFCGIAETGSLMLLSEPAVSAAAWFLPASLIVTLDKDRIFATQEDCWLELQLQPQTDLPRSITLMTGPSRTGDIEQKIVIGAHGPKNLHIVLIDNSSANNRGQQ